VHLSLLIILLYRWMERRERWAERH